MPDPKDRFWLLWRLWLHQTVVHPDGQKQGAPALAYLSADTRIPDGTIWHHNFVVSALEATRGTDGLLHPALLLFQIGPVQEFIAQARSTRDLWSGSYLLSWMMAHARKNLTDELGPDAVIFPSLRGQPLFDWLHQDLLRKAKHQQGEKDSKSFWEANDLGNPRHQHLPLTPNLPNRFLAIVPAGYDAKKLEAVFDASNPQSQWSHISEACLEFLKTNCGAVEGEALKRWRFQVEHFWQTTWQLWPWQAVPKALEELARIPAGENSKLALGSDVAKHIPAEHLDTRCYESSKDTHGLLQTRGLYPPRRSASGVADQSGERPRNLATPRRARLTALGCRWPVMLVGKEAGTTVEQLRAAATDTVNGAAWIFGYARGRERQASTLKFKIAKLEGSPRMLVFAPDTKVLEQAARELKGHKCKPETWTTI